MRQRKDALAKWLALEVGKPLVEGVGEVGGAADIFEWNSEETKRIFGQTVESRFENTRVQVESLGHVAVRHFQHGFARHLAGAAGAGRPLSYTAHSLRTATRSRERTASLETAEHEQKRLAVEEGIAEHGACSREAPGRCDVSLALAPPGLG